MPHDASILRRAPTKSRAGGAASAAFFTTISGVASRHCASAFVPRQRAGMPGRVRAGGGALNAGRVAVVPGLWLGRSWLAPCARCSGTHPLDLDVLVPDDLLQDVSRLEVLVRNVSALLRHGLKLKVEGRAHVQPLRPLRRPAANRHLLFRARGGAGRARGLRQGRAQGGHAARAAGAAGAQRRGVRQLRSGAQAERLSGKRHVSRAERRAQRVRRPNAAKHAPRGGRAA